MKRKILSLLLASVMIFSLISCSSSSDGGDATPTTQPAGTGTGTENPADTQTGQDVSPDDAVVEETPIDLGGYEFVLISNWMDYDINFNPIAAVEENETPYYVALYERLEQQKKDYNFTIRMNVIPIENFEQEIIALSMAGIKVADYIKTDYGRMARLYAAGVLREINAETAPAIDLNDTVKWNSRITETGTFLGKVYAFNFEREVGTMVFFNKTLLEEKGCTDPYQLYNEGNWNWNEFAKLVEYMTINETGGATPDIYGLGIQEYLTMYFQIAFIYANGGKAFKEENGGFRFALLDNEAQEALLFCKSLYDNRWVLPGQPRDVGSVWDIFARRKVAFWLGGPGENRVFAGRMEEDEFGMLPVPMGPQMDDFVTLRASPPLFCSPISVKDSDAFTSSFIFNLVSNPLPITGDPAIDDVDFDLKYNQLHDSISYDVIKMMREKGVTAEAEAIWAAQLQISDAIEQSTKFGETTPRAAMEAIADMCQAAVEDFFRAPE